MCACCCGNQQIKTMLADGASEWEVGEKETRSSHSFVCFSISAVCFLKTFLSRLLWYIWVKALKCQSVILNVFIVSPWHQSIFRPLTHSVFSHLCVHMLTQKTCLLNILLSLIYCSWFLLSVSVDDFRSFMEAFYKLFSILHRAWCHWCLTLLVLSWVFQFSQSFRLN